MPLEPIRPTPFIHNIDALRKELPFPIEPTNIPGIYHIPAPSDDFDPSTASQTELLRNGIYWQRPPWRIGRVRKPSKASSPESG